MNMRDDVIAKVTCHRDEFFLFLCMTTNGKDPLWSYSESGMLTIIACFHRRVGRQIYHLNLLKIWNELCLILLAMSSRRVSWMFETRWSWMTLW